MTEAETAAAEAHQTILRGIKGEIQGGRPGQRRQGSMVHEATSTGKDEGENTPNAFWQVKPKQREWNVAAKQPTFKARQHEEQTKIREAQQAEAKAIHYSQAQMRLNRLRQNLEALSPQKLKEKLTSSYVKMMFVWPPSQETKNEFLLASAEFAAREVLVEALESEISKQQAELDRLDA